MRFEELRKLNSNNEVREYLNSMSKSNLINYYNKNVNTSSNLEKKTKKALVDLTMESYLYIRRDEALDKIKF